MQYYSTQIRPSYFMTLSRNQMYINYKYIDSHQWHWRNNIIILGVLQFEGGSKISVWIVRYR